MKKRRDLNSKKGALESKEKVEATNNFFDKVQSVLKSKKIVAISLILLTLAIAIIAVFLNRENTTTTSMTINQELLRAMQYDQFEEGDEKVEATDNVEFSAFFLRDLDGDGYTEKIKGTCREIGQSDTLYMEINVLTEGYLKDAKIEIQGQNFYLQTALPEDAQLKQNYIGDNIKEIEFKDLNAGTQKFMEGIVQSGNSSYTSLKASAIGNDINNYSREDNKIILTGTYVDNNGNEIQIIKEIALIVDWYGEAKATIESINQAYYTLDKALNVEEDIIVLNFSINPLETKKELILSKNYVEGTIPELNGYAPLEVNFKYNTSSNLTFNYDSNTRTFVIENTASLTEEGKLSSVVNSSNSYPIEVIYPLDAYKINEEKSKVSIEIPVKTYYEGFNNENEPFENPYTSNVASRTIVLNTFAHLAAQEQATFDIEIGKNVYIYNSYRNIISKQKPLNIYNGISDKESDDIYVVKWMAMLGTNDKQAQIMMKESANEDEKTIDTFIKDDATTEKMENIVSNIGIYVDGADNMLTDEGWIKVYDDETDELLVTFTKDNWNNYNSSNPYKYEVPVKHIRVETSIANKEEFLEIYNVKEIDDDYLTSNYTREEFDFLKYIESTLNVYLDGNHEVTLNRRANYQAPYSVAEISLNRSKYSTQITEENVKIEITATLDKYANQVGWIDGAFLIKIPEEILLLEMNSIEINNENVEIVSQEIVENENGKFIKINTENKLEEEQCYTITLDVNITPDPRIESKTVYFDLYASNGKDVDYYNKTPDIYDVNSNLDITENVNKSSTSVSLLAPGTLLTNQTASEFDEQNSLVVSPRIVELQPRYGTTDVKTAKIGIHIKNNYSSTVSEVTILGKIPFEGNTTILGNQDLKSEFSTKMLNTGIEIPKELEGKVTVYYSENEAPTKEVSDSNNGWTLAENVSNWDDIKSYLIDFGNEILSVSTEYTFYYRIEIPTDVDLNKTAYSHHGIYFCLETSEGKYRTQTEPNKLGFKYVEKIDLELTKFQQGKEKVVSEAVYSVTDTETNQMKTAVTGLDGKLTITGIYAEKEYEIKEIKSPVDYELNPEIVKFTTSVDENGTVSASVIDGEVRDEIATSNNDNEKAKVFVKVEDEAKLRLKITKKEQGTENPVSYVKYRLKGNGIIANGKILTTNANGEIIVSGLKIGEEYTLEETKANGYYLANPIKFKVVNTDGVYTVETIEGTVKSGLVTEEDSLPTANLILENEKIPTFNLEINKIKKNIETEVAEEQSTETENAEEIVYLQGAKFKLYEGTKEIGEYTTDENGKILISNLYQYVDGKNIDATYTLKEVAAPIGYAKVKDITFKVQNINGTLTLINTNGDEEKYTIDGNTVQLTIEDSPSFRLVKKDKETGEVLANVKFAIYNVENGCIPATDSKGEILGAKENINGIDYYTVTTDSNGTLTIDLPEGLYKAVEVQAPEQYDIEGQTYYFGIGASRGGLKVLKAKWAKSIANTSSSNSVNYDDVLFTKDGGYIAIGTVYWGGIDFGNGYAFTSNGMDDALIVKYDSEGNVEWADAIGGDSYDKCIHLAEHRDGGYLVWVEFTSRKITLKDGTSYQNGGIGYQDAEYILIKYSTNGDIEWSKQYDLPINFVEVINEEKYMVATYLEEDTDLGNGVMVELNGTPSTAIITYDFEGTAEKVNLIPGNVTSIKKTEGDEYIVAGYYSENTIDFGNGVTLSKEDTTKVSYLVKYDSEFAAQWAKSYGTGELLIEITNDNGYVVATGFDFELDLNDGNTIIGNNEVIIIKYDYLGKIEWYKILQDSNSSDYEDLEYDKIHINQIFVSKDEGIIVNGGFGGEYLELENGLKLINKNPVSSSGPPVNISYRADEKFTLKYSKNGDLLWANNIGGVANKSINSIKEVSNDKYIIVGSFSSKEFNIGNDIILKRQGSYSNAMIAEFGLADEPNVVIQDKNTITAENNEYVAAVSEANDTGYVTGGYFDSANINIGDKTVSNNGLEDGILIKYSVTGEPEWYKVIGGDDNDRITDVLKTSDNGYLVSGYFRSETIDLGNGKVLKNSGYSDGMLIKYSPNGELEWYTGIGGKLNDSINSISRLNDNGYLVAGTYQDKITFDNKITINSNGETDIMIIKYDQDGKTKWARTLGGEKDDVVNAITSTQDEGYIIAGEYKSSIMEVGNEILLGATNSKTDGFLIKYDSNGMAEWGKTIGDAYEDGITDVIETQDGGFAITGFYQGTFELGNGIQVETYNRYSPDAMIVKLNKNGNIQWANTKLGEKFNTLIQLKDSGFVVGGEVENNEIVKYDSNGKMKWKKDVELPIIDIIELEDTSLVVGGNDYSNGMYDASIKKIFEENVISETQELIVENERKEFKITTSVKEVDGIKGGSISGEEENPFETISYGNSSTKEILITPDEGYGIQKITINGEEHIFTANEDGTCTIPVLTNVTEDKHIEVTFIVNENKFTINKIDNETKEGLSGATFRIDQIEERTEPEGIIGELTDNGDIYAIPDFENNRNDLLGELTDNGNIAGAVADKANEITGVKGTLTNNGTYYFVEEDGKYIPNNLGKLYTTAYSYMEIDLSDYVGDYAVVVNADVSIGRGSEYAFARITENTTALSYSSIQEKFMDENGTVVNKDYTSGLLTGGKVYYLHLGYYNSYGSTVDNDQVVINDVKIYKATPLIYNFQEIDGKYESTNQGQPNTTSNSYIPIDLTNVEGNYKVIVNAEISSSYSDYGYATITQDTTAPVYNDYNGRFIYAYNANAKNYESPVLEGGKLYYLHFGYYKNQYTDSGEDIFRINSVNLYGTKNIQYNFTEVDGKYESTNQGTSDKEANSYISIDLTGLEGKYNVIVNANVSSEKYGDIGYATITQNNLKPGMYGGSNFIEISGTEDNVTIPKNYTTVIEGGSLYYLHLGYYKNSSINEGDDKFTVNSIKVVPNTDHLYHTQVTTNSVGQGITQIPYGKYAITEIVAPEGYELNENSIIVDFTADGEKEFTIENTKLAKVIVHHYEAIESQDGTVTYTENKLVEDDILQDKAGYEYSTSPKLDIPEYGLLTDGDGNYILPENATGQYLPGEQEVTYYYVKKSVPVTVNHYVEGTEEPVTLQSGQEAEEVKTYGNAGESYTTEPIKPEELHEKYELVETPSNATGTYEYTDVVVNYYYRVKRFNVMTSVVKHEETDLLGNVIEVEGGTILGQDEESYEEVQYGEDSQKDIIATPMMGYSVRRLSVNGADVNFTANEDGTVEVDKFVDMKEDKEVAVTFSRDQGQVIVHHYLEGTTEKVPSNTEGQVVEDETKSGSIGSPFATKPSENVAPQYESVSSSVVTSGTYTDETIEVTYYYTLKDFEYKVEYYYGDFKDNTKTEKSEVEYGTIIENYTDKIKENYKFDKVENLPLTIGTNPEENVIKVHYKPEDGLIIVKYIDRNTGNEIAEETVVEGEVFSKHDTKDDVKEIEGYQVVSYPNPSEVEFTEEGKVYSIYYAKETKVIVNHIDKDTDENIETVEDEGLVGDWYISKSKDFDGYMLVQKPEDEKVLMTEEPLVLNYYYTKQLTNVLEKHIDIKSNEILDNTLYEGKVGDEYATEEKEFEGYDIAENKDVYTEEQLTEKGLNPKDSYTPENATGTMAEELIEVRYYYIRKASVRVQFVDKATGENMKETIEVDEDGDGVYDKTEEVDVIEITKGHEGDLYETTSKKFDNYELVEDELPENATGTMEITIDETGNVVTETLVTYYYLPEAKVVEKHIDIKTEKEIEQDTVHNGYVGKDYRTTSKDFEGYDLVKEQLPENSEGQMTKETIEVTYYYIRKTNVIVEYIDKETGEKIFEIVEKDNNGDGITDEKVKVDSTEEFEGHEGDSYEAKVKELEGYELIKEEYPKNEKGIMTVVTNEDGTVNTTTYVKYYYSKIKVEEPEKPDVSEDTQTTSKVIVKYLERGTNKVLAEEVVKTGKVGEEYTTDAKSIANYTLEKEPNNKNGVMTKEDIIVTYYYYFTNPPAQQAPSESKPTTPSTTIIPTSTNKATTTTNNKGNGPATGDMTPLIYIGIIGVVVIANIVLEVKQKKNDKKAKRKQH